MSLLTELVGKYCVAYLADVPALLSSQEFVSGFFRTSTWFTSRWTLQELLAPKLVFFCCVNGEQLGVKSSSMADGKMLSDTIASITGIPSECLRRPEVARKACFAQKLSWAAHRRMIRSEDSVYCLLGLLDINMPLLYGEGIEKAYIRLQRVFLHLSPS